MKACVPVFIFLCLLSLSALAAAQPQASEASEELAACERDLAQSRQALREANKAVAEALAKEADYSPQELTEAYQKVKEAQATEAEARLRALLYYKKTFPHWRPQSKGRSVTVRDLAKSPEENEALRQERRQARQKAQCARCAESPSL